MNNFDKIIKENDFIIPNYTNLNIVDLVRCLYNYYGTEFDVNKNMEKLQDIIPKNKHTLLILSDGTGSNIIEKLPDNNILKKNKVDDILTVFPSTTGCVLTSLVTAEFPSKHGIWGWYNYYRNKDINYYPLLFSERNSEKSLLDYGLKPEEIFITKSKLSELNCVTNVLFPNYINDSIYSKFVLDDKYRYGYENFDDIVKFMKENCSNKNKSYTYLYLPDIDNIEHDYGIDSKKVFDKLNEISEMVEKLSKINELTIVFTADHGQMNVHNDVVMDFNKYKKYFYSDPTIDFGTASYYVKNELKEEFIKEFNKDFKDKMYLFETSEFDKRKIFGLDELNIYSRSGLGEFISLCKKDYCFINSSNIEEYYQKTLGNHSGLTKDEMLIPLIVINTNNIL